MNKIRINDEITSKEVRIIDEDGSTIMSLKDALKKANDEDLDLIEVSPKAFPPVCKIMDYQKFLYQQKKREKELLSKQQKVVIKEIRLNPHIDTHDYNVKLKQCQEFLRKKMKIKFSVFFKGRAIQFKEQGEILLLRFASDLSEIGKVEQMPKLEGKRMLMTMMAK